MENRGKRALITGAEGFIGHHLARKLIDRGGSVCGYDNRSTGQRRIEGPRYYAGDLQSEFATENLIRILDEHGIDVVYHLAAQGSVPRSWMAPSYVANNNIQGTIHVLEAVRCCSLMHKPRVIFASSSSVYGDSDQVPRQETQALGHALSPYAMTKQAGESLCRMYADSYQMEIIPLRFFNVYGPNMRSDTYGSVFAHWERAWRKKEHVHIRGDMTAIRRSFTYVDDLTDVLDRAGRYPLDVPNGQPINACGPQSASLQDLLNFFTERFGRSPAQIKHQARQGDIEDGSGAPGRLGSWLVIDRWHTLAEGLARVYDADQWLVDL